MCGFSERVEALPFKIWRDHITNMIHTANFQYNGNNNHKLGLLRAKVAHFEDEYPKLKEITTILELALWKLKMNENIIPQEKAIHCQKKVKTINQRLEDNAALPVELTSSSDMYCHG
jgi:hypothetical protein